MAMSEITKNKDINHSRKQYITLDTTIVSIAAAESGISVDCAIRLPIGPEKK